MSYLNKSQVRVQFICLAVFAIALESNVSSRVDELTFVKRPSTEVTNSHYISNREPLAPSHFIKLPVGKVTPEGWLRVYLERQRSGLTGKLGEISAWLQKEDNAWLDPKGQGKWGWEEVPYWLKGYANIGYVLNDEQIIEEAKIWLEGALQSQRPNGDFGPARRFGDDGSRDYWANMIMLFCLQSYHEHSGDDRVLELMTNYFKFQLSVHDEGMLTHYWQRMRGGDNLYSIYWLYNRTGDHWLLELAEKMHKNTANWTQRNTLPNWHNVNIAQAFGEPATFYLQSKQPEDLQAAYRNFKKIRAIYGQVPGGMFGGDENSRPGYDDPRQAIETCGVVEQMLSDELLLCITGDPMWADHCEDVAFNTYPAATMPEFKSLRYLTSPNMVKSDSENHHPGIDNRGPFLVMNPLSHRCCQHNHSHGWPYYCEHLWLATPDNGVCAALYCASEASVRVGEGEGVEVTFKEETNYPFEDRVRLQIETPEEVKFPLYLRIPAWCEQPRVVVNGSESSVTGDAKGYVRIERVWKAGDTVELHLPMKIDVRTWQRNHYSVSVDYGPLTFSLKIAEQYVQRESDETALGDSQWQKDVNLQQWPSTEIHPDSPWNYGLVLDAEAPNSSFEVKTQPWPEDDFPFTQEAAPIRLVAQAKQIPEWIVDRHGLCAPLQDSPVYSDKPIQEVELIPMGAARLRICAFPVIGEGSEANRWQAAQIPKLLPFSPTASHCYSGDTIDALCDQMEPSNSGDHSIPRMTWWDHKGSKEWIQYQFNEQRDVESVEVYWFDDHQINGGCRIPKSWRLLYQDGEQWKPVSTSDKYGVQRDAYNKVQFSHVSTTGLRIEVDLQKDYSAGLLEWRVR